MTLKKDALAYLHIPVKSHTHSGTMPHRIEKIYWLE
jgi:hypothetical protein